MPLALIINILPINGYIVSLDNVPLIVVSLQQLNKVHCSIVRFEQVPFEAVLGRDPRMARPQRRADVWRAQFYETLFSRPHIRVRSVSESCDPPRDGSPDNRPDSLEPWDL